MLGRKKSNESKEQRNKQRGKAYEYVKDTAKKPILHI